MDIELIYIGRGDDQGSHPRITTAAVPLRIFQAPTLSSREILELLSPYNGTAEIRVICACFQRTDRPGVTHILSRRVGRNAGDRIR